MEEKRIQKTKIRNTADKISAEFKKVFSHTDNALNSKTSAENPSGYAIKKSEEGANTAATFVYSKSMHALSEIRKNSTDSKNINKRSYGAYPREKEQIRGPVNAKYKAYPETGQTESYYGKTLRAQAAQDYSLRKKASSAKRAADGFKQGIRKLAEGESEKRIFMSSGGAAIIVIIIIIAVIACVLFSSFGIFFADEAQGNNDLKNTVRSVDSSYTSEIDNAVAKLKKSAKGSVKIVYTGSGDGDSASVNNWNDVLAVFSVITSSEGKPVTATGMTDYHKKLLKSIFNKMNSYSIKKTDVLSYAVKDGHVVKVYKRYIYITQKSLSYNDAISVFKLNEDQAEELRELMSPYYIPYFASLSGVDIYGGCDITGFVSGLPSRKKGSEIVKAALTKLGCPYVWGSKGDTSFDCSGLVYWAVKQVDPKLGSKLYTNAANQAKTLYNMGRSVGKTELQPGDLVFWKKTNCDGCGRWKEIHHTGIYAGNGKVVEASSSKGRVVLRDLWSSSGYPIIMYQRVFE